MAAEYGEHDGLIGIGDIMKQVEGHIGDVMEGVAGELLEQLRAATPIDTGRARQSWGAFVDSYTQGGMTGEPPFIGGVEIELRKNNAARFMSAPRTSKVAGIQFDPKKNTNIVVSSNVPYMARLNRGWSTQQPTPGWIEACIDRVTAQYGIV